VKATKSNSTAKIDAIVPQLRRSDRLDALRMDQTNGGNFGGNVFLESRPETAGFHGYRIS
jgi:hypothetical protein